MTTLSDIWQAWTAQAQINPPPSQDDATDILQTFAPTVSDADGDAWFVAVATELERLGIINQPTYVQMRNWADGNEAGANELFDALLLAMNNLTESAVVIEGLRVQCLADQKAAINPNITEFEALRKAGSTVAEVQFNVALDQAIFALQQLDTEI